MLNLFIWWHTLRNR